jgi:hypothetical protein
MRIEIFVWFWEMEGLGMMKYLINITARLITKSFYASDIYEVIQVSYHTRSTPWSVFKIFSVFGPF